MPHESTIVGAGTLLADKPIASDKPIAEKGTVTADKPAFDKPIATDKPAIEDDEEDFNPLGKIEGWSAYECASGPFGYRG